MLQHSIQPIYDDGVTSIACLYNIVDWEIIKNQCYMGQEAGDLG